MERLDEFPIVFVYMVAEDTHTRARARARTYKRSVRASAHPKVFFLK